MAFLAICFGLCMSDAAVAEAHKKKQQQKEKPKVIENPPHREAPTKWRDMPLVGKHDLLKQIGKGGFSEIWLAENKETHKIVALKAVQLTNSDLEPDEVETLMAEAKYLRSLDCPYLLKCHEVAATTDWLVMVLEYLSGGEMLDNIHKCKKYSEAHAAMLFAQVVSAVSYLHNLNIMHRDIKPENVLFVEPVEVAEGNNRPLRVKVIDLGMAALYNPDKDIAGCVGTPGFVPPEIWHDKPHTPAMDVYALGVMLFVMLTGRKPHAGADIRNMNYTNKPIAAAPGLKDERFLSLSAEARELLLSMMADNPKDRPTCMAVLKHPFIAAVDSNLHAHREMGDVVRRRMRELMQLRRVHGLRYALQVQRQGAEHAAFLNTVDTLRTKMHDRTGGFVRESGDTDVALASLDQGMARNSLASAYGTPSAWHTAAQQQLLLPHAARGSESSPAPDASARVSTVAAVLEDEPWLGDDAIERAVVADCLAAPGSVAATAGVAAAAGGSAPSSGIGAGSRPGSAAVGTPAAPASAASGVQMRTASPFARASGNPSRSDLLPPLQREEAQAKRGGDAGGMPEPAGSATPDWASRDMGAPVPPELQARPPGSGPGSLERVGGAAEGTAGGYKPSPLGHVDRAALANTVLPGLSHCSSMPMMGVVPIPRAGSDGQPGGGSPVITAELVENALLTKCMSANQFMFEELYDNPEQLQQLLAEAQAAGELQGTLSLTPALSRPRPAFTLGAATAPAEESGSVSSAPAAAHQTPAKPPVLGALRTQSPSRGGGSGGGSANGSGAVSPSHLRSVYVPSGRSASPQRASSSPRPNGSSSPQRAPSSPRHPSPSRLAHSPRGPAAGQQQQAQPSPYSSAGKRSPGPPSPQRLFTAAQPRPGSQSPQTSPRRVPSTSRRVTAPNLVTTPATGAGSIHRGPEKGT